MRSIECFDFDLDVNRNDVQRILDEYATEHGDGGIGLPRKIEWKDEKFDTYDEAWSHIRNTLDSGYYKQIAVQYRDENTAKKTKKWIELENRIDTLRTEYENRLSKFEFENIKSEFITCKECGSKISVKHMNSNNCPVCHHDMRSKTVMNGIEKAKDKLDQAKERLHKEIMKQIPKMKYRWLVKIEYHC